MRTSIPFDSPLARPVVLAMAFLLLICGIKDIRYAKTIVKEAFTLPHNGSDFASYYLAGKCAATKRSPYWSSALEEAKRATGLFQKEMVLAPYIYPPVTLVVYEMLSRMSYTNAYFTTIGVSIILLVLAGWLLMQLLAKEASAAKYYHIPIFLLFLLQTQVWANLKNGQANILLLFLLIAAAWLAQKQSGNANMLGGFCLMLAASIKLFPILALPFIGIGAARRKTFFAGTLIGFTCLIALNFLLFPTKFTTDYLTLLQNTGGVFGINFRSMPSATSGNASINGLMANLAAIYSGSTDSALIQETFYYPLCLILLAAVGISGFFSLCLEFAQRVIRHVDVMPWQLGFMAILYYQLLSPMVWSLQFLLISPCIWWLIWKTIHKEATLSSYVTLIGIFIYLSGLFFNIADLIRDLFSRSIALYIARCIQSFPTIALSALVLQQAYQILREQFRTYFDKMSRTDSISKYLRTWTHKVASRN